MPIFKYFRIIVSLTVEEKQEMESRRKERRFFGCNGFLLRVAKIYIIFIVTSL